MMSENHPWSAKGWLFIIFKGSVSLHSFEQRNITIISIKLFTKYITVLKLLFVVRWKIIETRAVRMARARFLISSTWTQNRTVEAESGRVGQTEIVARWSADQKIDGRYLLDRLVRDVLHVAQLKDTVAEVGGGDQQRVWIDLARVIRVYVEAQFQKHKQTWKHLSSRRDRRKMNKWRVEEGRIGEKATVPVPRPSNRERTRIFLLSWLCPATKCRPPFDSQLVRNILIILSFQLARGLTIVSVNDRGMEDVQRKHSQGSSWSTCS